MTHAQQFVNEPLEWQVSAGFVPYLAASEDQDRRAAAIADGMAQERFWLLEHPPLITAGTSARDADLLEPDRFPLFRSPRGGQYTYHGPGQRIVYVQLDLGKRGRDVRAFVCAMEKWIIATLATFGVQGERRDGRVGVWVAHPHHGEAKIAAIGVRVRRWVTLHGLSINVNPDLSHFRAIVPCGISEFGVTSMHDLGVQASMDAVDDALKANMPAFLDALG